MKLETFIALGFCAAALLACGGDVTTATTGSDGSGAGHTGTGGQGSTGWEQFCEKRVARDMMCDPGNPPSPTLDECKGAASCYAALFRDDVESALRDCLAGRPCGKSDDACLGEAAATITPSAAATAFAQACADKHQTCPDGSFSDDDCDVSMAALFADASSNAAAPCFQKPCDQVSACLEAAYAALAQPCGGSIGF